MPPAVHVPSRRRIANAWKAGDCRAVVEHGRCHRASSRTVSENTLSVGFWCVHKNVTCRRWSARRYTSGESRLTDTFHRFQYLGPIIGCRFVVSHATTRQPRERENRTVLERSSCWSGRWPSLAAAIVNWSRESRASTAAHRLETYGLMSPRSTTRPAVLDRPRQNVAELGGALVVVQPDTVVRPSPGSTPASSGASVPSTVTRVTFRTAGGLCEP